MLFLYFACDRGLFSLPSPSCSQMRMWWWIDKHRPISPLVCWKLKVCTLNVPCFLSKCCCWKSDMFTKKQRCSAIGPRIYCVFQLFLKQRFPKSSVEGGGGTRILRGAPVRAGILRGVRPASAGLHHCIDSFSLGFKLIRSIVCMSIRSENTWKLNEFARRFRTGFGYPKNSFEIVKFRMLWGQRWGDLHGILFFNLSFFWFSSGCSKQAKWDEMSDTMDFSLFYPEQERFEFNFSKPQFDL
jgi:hypothetical protein